MTPPPSHFVGFLFTAGLMPFSDTYVSEKFVDTCRKSNLLGIEYFELVFNNAGPLIPTYNSGKRGARTYSYRYILESVMFAYRGSASFSLNDNIGELVRKLEDEGLFACQDSIPNLQNVKNFLLSRTQPLPDFIQGTP